MNRLTDLQRHLLDINSKYAVLHVGTVCRDNGWRNSIFFLKGIILICRCNMGSFFELCVMSGFSNPPVIIWGETEAETDD